MGSDAQSDLKYGMFLLNHLKTGYCRVSIPKGSYATSVLREVMKKEVY